MLIVRDSGKRCGGPKGVLGVGFLGPSSTMLQGSEMLYHPHHPNRTAKAVLYISM